MSVAELLGAAPPATLRQQPKTVLMIDYFFPPFAGAGVQRTLGYVKHLAEFGWEPIVLTIQPGERAFYDFSLLDRVPDSVNVQRTPSLEPVRFARRLLDNHAVVGNGHGSAPRGVKHPSSWVVRRMRNLERWILFPDRRIGWFPFAAIRALSTSHQKTIDVIYSTSTVMTSHLVAYAVGKLLRKPWVADFQDPWSADINGFPTFVHKMLADRLELRILHCADRITVTTDPVRKMLLGKDPAVPADKVVTIPMGFDPDAFKDLARPPQAKFAITHFGSFYGPRSPIPFLAALNESLRQRPRLGQDVEVFFFGKFDPQLLALTEAFLDQHELRQIVHIMGTVQYATGLRHLLGSSVLLLVTGAGLWGQSLVPSKIFEYLAAGRPILALAPQGAAAEIVSRVGAGLVIEPDNVHAIRDGILNLHSLWSERRLAFSPDRDLIQTFTWRELTRRFASTLEDALGANRVSKHPEGLGE